MVSTKSAFGWLVGACLLVFAAFGSDALAQSRDLSQFDAATRAAAESARAASMRGTAAAARAFDNGAGTISFRAVEGDRYNGEGYGSGESTQRNGFGLITWSDGEYYAGQFAAGRQSGLKEGYGVYSFVDGRVYEGQWLNDLRHGYGVQWSADGSVFLAGRWDNGNPVE